MEHFSGQVGAPYAGKGVEGGPGHEQGAGVDKQEMQSRLDWIVARRGKPEKEAGTVRWSELQREIPLFRERPEVIVTAQGEFEVVDDVTPVDEPAPEE